MRVLRHLRILSSTLLCVALFIQCSSSDSEGSEGPDDQRAAPTMFDAPAEDSLPNQASPRPDIPDSAPAVLFLSDSIGAGLHLAEQQSFPRVLQARMADAGLPFQLINSCESGRTTAGGVTALAWVLRRKPQLVVIALGGNDGLRGIGLDVIESNLCKMILAAHEAEAKVLLLGIVLPPNFGEYGNDFNALYPKLAQEYGIPFLPYYMEGVGGVPEMNLEDGLHPTAQGHERLADNVMPALKAALGASQQASRSR